mgnify:FL=1|jgi:quercetin dioxygenase-like cupin family protein
MSFHGITHIKAEEVLSLPEEISYQPGQVASKTLTQNAAVSLTLFAFDKNEEIGRHVSSGDALLTVLEGKARITIGEGVHELSQGQTVLMPAGIPHAVYAEECMKMALTVVFPAEKEA